MPDDVNFPGGCHVRLSSIAEAVAESEAVAIAELGPSEFWLKSFNLKTSGL